ncbi:MAG TPA: S8 family serine peptidase [Miltoncostaeaceae bacterium]|nr:S8 family serine peptidase [Miltoncostaeaceae bacterium]
MLRLLSLGMLCLAAALAGCASASSDRGPAPEASRPVFALPGDPAGGAPSGVTSSTATASGDAERVEVVAVGGAEAARDLLERLGATIEVTSGNRIQALVPVEHIDDLERSAVVEVEPTGLVVPLQTATNALQFMGADRWQAAGFSGHGVKVAVVDSGFSGYADVLGDTLPANVVARSFRSDGNIAGGSDHGLRAAEVVHRVAPGAQLYLVNFATITEFGAAVDYLIAEGVDIVSFSLGFIHNGPGDGSGAVNQVVARGTAAGQTWAVAAGNWAQQHWSGLFTDMDGDSIHEFEPGVQEITHMFSAGDLVLVSLRWDDPWGAACSDYDVELFGPGGALVGASRDIQACEGDPVEAVQVLATQSGAYTVRIVEAHSEGPHTLDLMMVGSPDRGNPVDFPVPHGSLSEPADHPAVVTVGALAPNEVQVLAEAPFSSRGPTTDGRIKPNVLAPTGLCCGAPGQIAASEAFAGTSAAAPHVAGALALLLEAFPESDRATLTQRLVNRAAAAPPVEDGTTLARVVQLGSLFGLGPLLPEGGLDAAFLPEPPPADLVGLAILLYRGPDGYPVRFVHLLANGRTPAALFRLDTDDQRFLAWIAGAPEFVNDFDTIPDGEIVIARFE